MQSRVQSWVKKMSERIGAGPGGEGKELVLTFFLPVRINKGISKVIKSLRTTHVQLVELDSPEHLLLSCLPSAVCK